MAVLRPVDACAKTSAEGQLVRKWYFPKTRDLDTQITDPNMFSFLQKVPKPSLGYWLLLKAESSCEVHGGGQKGATE